MLRIALIVVGSFMITSTLIAQKIKTHQQLVWASFDESIKLKHGLLFHFLTEERRYLSPFRQHQFFYRGELYYRFNTQNTNTIGIGFTNLLQSLPHNAELPIEVTVPELRGAVIYKTAKQYAKLKMSHRYVLEWRNFRNHNGTELTKGFVHHYRVRYKFGLEYPLFDNKLAAYVYNETMFNFGKRIVYNTFDQNRTGVGIKYNANQSLTLRVSYVKWFQQRSTGTDFFSRDIYRFTIFHKLNFE